MARRLLMLIGLSIAVSGCESRLVPTKESASADRPAQTESSASPSGDITATVVDPAGFQAAVAKHLGQVVLVDCWATWCIPCREAFPHTVELHRKYSPQGLAVISLSFDDPTDQGAPPPKVVEFLKEQRAAFENYVSGADLGTPEAAALSIDEEILPHYKLYGRDGRLIKAFSGGDPEEPLTPAAIENAVAMALK
ncbi:MAG: thioredoxin domain-containing protein [Planctomycetaceae bacterium]